MATARLKDIRLSGDWCLSISGRTFLWGYTFSPATSNQQALPSPKGGFTDEESGLLHSFMSRRWCRMDDQGKTARSVSNCQLYMAFSHATSSSFILNPSSRIVCFPSPTSLYCQRAAPLKSMSSIEEISKAAITADLARNLTPLIISWVSTWKHLTPTDHLWKTWRGCANDGRYWKPVPAVFVNHRARVGPYQARYCTFLPTRLLSLRSLL